MIMQREIDIKKYTLPDENSMLWRYMDLSKLLYLITTRKLYLHRIDKFEDVFEAAVPESTLASGTEAYKFLEEAYLINCYSEKDKVQKMNTFIPSIKEKYKVVAEKFKVSSYVTCFHMNEYESAAMWNLYTQGKDGVAIQTTIKKLVDTIEKAASDEQYYLGKVVYSDFSKSDIDFVYPYSLALTKRISFEHEREVRLFKCDRKIFTSKYEDLKNTPIGINISNIDIEDFINEIIISPYADSYIQEIIEGILEKYNYKIKVTKSNLYNII